MEAVNILAVWVIKLLLDSPANPYKLFEDLTFSQTLIENHCDTCVIILCAAIFLETFTCCPQACLQYWQICQLHSRPFPLCR